MHIRLLQIALFISFLSICQNISAQTTTVQDDFEGNGTITTWFGDDCGININLSNPFSLGINTSATVLEYVDNGGQYANVRFQVDNTFDLSVNHTFSLKIYVPSSGLTGNQNNQISLKLQDGTIGDPWTTQSEIIKPLILNQWQEVTFDFQNDNYINLDPNSLIPVLRTDFNRIVIQVNGENNYDHVIAYIDDVLYDGTIAADPVFDMLVWSDEFDGNGSIDNSKWFHQTQLPSSGSWYNGEIQHYTNRVENSVLTNGKLIITAQSETFTDQGVTKQYTSARLNTKFAFTYGMIEVRAKLPSGTGTWPAIWTLGKNINESGAYWQTQGFGSTSWPACGEIDIMEHWGSNQNYVQSAMHTPSSYGSTVNVGGQYLPTASTDFHIYTLKWTEDKMIFSVDNVTHYTYQPAVQNANTWPFDLDQYLIMNVAILPGIDPNFTSSTLEVDYVRIYQEGPVTNTDIVDKNIPTLYPNPVRESLIITLIQETSNNVPIQFYHISGQLIKTYQVSVIDHTITIDKLDFLSTGMYLIKYQIGNESYCNKILKE